MSDVVERAKEALSDYRWAQVCRVTAEPRRAYRLIEELITEVERLHTWDGVMSLLDEHYPADIFPTMEDRPDRDAGTRIISLIRRINEIREAQA